MRHYTKALIVAFGLALALVVGARAAAADDFDWLRLVCATLRRNTIPWDLAGCWQLADDRHDPRA